MVDQEKREKEKSADKDQGILEAALYAHNEA